MQPTQITTRGSFTAYRPPERATVHAQVGLEGPDPAAVYDGVVARVDELSASIVELHDPAAGPVTWYSVQDIRTWAERPWHQEGKQLPLVHHATAGLQIKFADFEVASRWLTSCATVTGFRVERIEWTLTEAHREQVTTEARSAAVRDARDKAQVYADALDLGPVRVLALADGGMLGESPQPLPGGVALAAYAREATTGDEARGGVELLPRDIEIRAEVDARFEVGPGDEGVR